MRTRLMILLLIVQCSLHAQLQEETRTILFPATGEMAPEGVVIAPDASFEQTVTFEKSDDPVRRYLRVVGGVEMPGRFAPRGEEFFRQAEYLLDDHLDSLTRYRDRYSLYFQGEHDAFERYAYQRVSGDLPRGARCTIEWAVQRKQLKVAPEGMFGVQLQVYYQKEGRHPDEVYDTPDTIITIPIPAGSGTFKLQKTAFVLPEKSACILLRVGGRTFSGACWLEAPRLYHEGRAFFSSPFVHHEDESDDYNYWVGVNLSTRSWPKWQLTFRGKQLFEGHLFDRASDIADFYIPLPQGLEGTGEMKLTLLKEPHRTAHPYRLRSLQLLEERAGDLEIVVLPRYFAKGDTGGILIETNRPHQTLHLSTGDAVQAEKSQYTFAQTGLHVIPLVAKEPGVNVPVVITSGEARREGVIEQVVLKARDDVRLSSGDEIYIDKEYAPYDYFFKWYFRERIGNMYQFRPSYQWSGVRITDEQVMSHYIDLLNKMHVPFAWQVEGRTLASEQINISHDALASPMYRGKQAHENDGGYYYWQHFLYKGLFSDMAARARPYGGIFAKHRPIYTDRGVFIHYDPYGVKDMADGANRLVANLSYSRGESSRHTGPSTMFRYLYQAGYDWLGAEQMYGPEDIIMSSLRGASRAYHKKEYGTLHAMQWGSHPFTDPQHALRFYLSLAVAYMHGSSHINTEEALWTDEYSNDRYTESGRQHLYAQQQMMDYIETHARKGTLNTKIGVLQGRNDAWKSFVRGPVWSQLDARWAFNAAQESFDLLKIFYPESEVDACGPKGWFSSTPYGPIDILPIEASAELLTHYRTLIFLGWNSFDNGDFIRLRKFVEQGGTLILTAAHLNSTLAADAPVSFPDDDTVIKSLLGLDYKTYSAKTVITRGRGTVIYYPEKCYPSDSSIMADYKESIRAVAAAITEGEHARGWVTEAPCINFSVWDQDALRTIYLLNTDWESEEERQMATLILNKQSFPVEVGRYTIPTIRCYGPLAAMMGSNRSDVLSITEKEQGYIVSCQTTGADRLTFFDGVTGNQRTVEIDEAGVFELFFKNE